MTSPSQSIADFLEIQGRFRRSIHLEKDSRGASPNGEYILTPTARKILRRLAEGIPDESPCRAWTLTGPYGVGKSAFAVFLTHLFCGTGQPGKQARWQLEKEDPQLYGHLRELGLFHRGGKGFHFSHYEDRFISLSF